MFKPTIYQRVRRKINRLRLLQPLRRLLLNNKDFSIISNNCWGGICYEYFGMRKDSPTIGLWFFAEDYIKFVSNLKYYLSLEMIIINPKEAKCYSKLIEMKSTDGLVGVLGDIEISLLHYHDPEIALKKWNRRVKRINYDNLILKFSYMNGCTYDLLKDFDELDLSKISSNYKKIMFVPKPMPEFKSSIYVKGFEGSGQISNDTFVFNQYFDLFRFLNNKGLRQK